jgi:hypothetical protein
MKMDGTTFKDTSDVNLIVTDGVNAALGVGVLGNVTSGSDNVAVGDEALNILTTGATNTAVGTQSLATLLTGNDNVCIGNASGGNYTSSESNNICIGTSIAGTAGESNRIHIGTSSHNNLYIGNRAMYVSVGGTCSFGSVIASTGIANSAFGSDVLAALTTGASNTAIGWSAMQVATTGGSNCALGRNALVALTTGSSNVAIGYDAGSSYTSSETNNICLGYNVTGTLGESNVIRIGTSSHNNLYIRNRAMYKSTGGNCSFGSAPTATGTANSAFGSACLQRSLPERVIQPSAGVRCQQLPQVVPIAHSDVLRLHHSPPAICYSYWIRRRSELYYIRIK